MPLSPATCAVCLSEDGFNCEAGPDGDRDATRYECDVCGPYSASRNAEFEWLAADANRLTKIQRAVLSHRLRSENDTGRRPEMLLTTEIEEFVQRNPQLPVPSQQATNIIRFIGEIVSTTGEPIELLAPRFHAKVGSPSRAFALNLLFELKRRGLAAAIQLPDMNGPLWAQDVTLTLAGWELYEEERKGTLAGNYGFLALKFGDPILDPLVADHVKPAIATIGFGLVDMRDVARAGVIDNLMRVQIRDAAFVVVDLTHENAGAYWEAGYAEGLGKPVLYICEKSKFAEKKTHFDTNHCTTVLWDVAAIPHFIEELIATLRRSLNI